MPPSDREIARSVVVVQPYGGARSSKLKHFALAGFEIALPDVPIWIIYGIGKQRGTP